MDVAPKVSAHVVSFAARPFKAQRVNIDGRDDDFFAWSRICLGEDATIEIHHHAATGPTKGWIMREACTLVRSDHVGRVFQRSRSIHRGPPIHGLGGSPWIHVCRHPNDDLSAVECNLSNRFWE